MPGPQGFLAAPLLPSLVCPCVSFATPLPSQASPGRLRDQAPGTHLGEMLLCPCLVSDAHRIVTVPEHLRHPPTSSLLRVFFWGGKNLN